MCCSRKGNSSKTLDNGHKGIGRPQSKQRRLSKPVLRGQPGYVYSKKMTLGCTRPLPRSKLHGVKKRVGAFEVGSDGGVTEVRSILPWWPHSSPQVGAESKQVESQSTRLDDPSRLAKGLEGVACHHGADDAHLHATPKAVAVEQTTPQLPTSTLAPESEPSNKADGKDDTHKITTSGDGENTHSSRKDDDNDQRGKKEYAHHSNLFENPPPSIPNVDQYIFNDNITYEAITKRGHLEALPVSQRAFLGIEKCGDDPWAAVCGGGGDGGGGTGGVGDVALEPYVHSSALLYADEDIDQVIKYDLHSTPSICLRDCYGAVLSGHLNRSF